jgi:pimeloyl-ACP methyl ester carboxylesterase
LVCSLAQGSGRGWPQNPHLRLGSRGLRLLPYVLVSHSLGSSETLLFADHHPHETVGMVLVDPSFPGQSAVIARTYPNVYKLTAAMAAQNRAATAKCVTGLKSGALKPADPALADCTNDATDYPFALKHALLPLNADPKRLLTQQAYRDAEDADSVEAINSHRAYGHTPLIVLTATESPEGLPPAIATPAFKAEMRDMLTKTWWSEHRKLATLSTSGQERRIVGTTHYIQLIKPEVVVAAINQVVEEARSVAAKP